MQVGDQLVGDGRGPGVRVLGPATIGAQSATQRQRALIAALALAGQRGADIDELADGVWGGRPPNSARSSLQNQMTRLRRLHGDDLIVCEHARYLLGRPTDVAQFEGTLVRVRSAPLTRASVDSLAGALDLWRGTPYVDLTDSHTAEIERARLAQERARAADLLATGRIQLRDYEQCITELRAEVEDDPYRDRAWELLFVALQRAGRPSEALAAHREYVDRLRGQFGVEPSASMIDVGRALKLGTPIDVTADGGVPRLVAAPATATPSRGRCLHDPVVRHCRVRGRRRRRRVDP
ncbi:MAG: bacterial transcriptional activator domain-containing protein [Acidimicrobiales bacterium]